MLERRTTVLVVLALTTCWSCRGSDSVHAASQSPDVEEPVAAQVNSRESQPCDTEGIKHAKAKIDPAPIEAVKILLALPECDDKFATLYLAESEIARRVNPRYFYQGKVYPTGWYGNPPDAFGQYVIDNHARFNSGQEGGVPITAGRHWLDRIADQQHEVIGTYEFSKIQELDQWYWEDGDGSKHTNKLLASYQEWLDRWPNHPAGVKARQRMEVLKKGAETSNYGTQPPGRSGPGKAGISDGPRSLTADV